MAKCKVQQRPYTTWAKLPAIIDAETAAVVLGINAQIVRRMARAGELPAKKVGKKVWRFEKSALMAYVGFSEGVTK